MLDKLTVQSDTMYKGVRIEDAYNLDKIGYSEYKKLLPSINESINLFCEYQRDNKVSELSGHDMLKNF
jgi:hypothetical protein